VSKALRYIVKSVLYLLDLRDDLKDRAQNVTHNLAHVIRGRNEHLVRSSIGFASGLGVGIGLGVLFAPASGGQTRRSVAGKLHAFGDRFRRFPQIRGASGAYGE
jgi:hypothetical protein